jgi:ferredoxin
VAVHLLTLEPSGERFAVRPGETVLGAVERAGWAYRRGCRRGGCGACVGRLVDGALVNERPIAPQVLSAEQLAEGFVVTCRAVPTADVVVRLRDDADLRRVSALQHQLAQRELGAALAERDRHRSTRGA